MLFLFGDTLARQGGDVIGTSRTTDPDRGLRMDFLTDGSGKYLRVQPRGIDMKGFDVPVSGISLDGKLYIVVKTNHSLDSPTDNSVLTSFDESQSNAYLSVVPKAHSRAARARAILPARILNSAPSGATVKRTRSRSSITRRSAIFR